LGDLLTEWSAELEPGRVLVGVRIRPSLNECDGPPDDAWKVHSFLKGTETIYLGVGLSPVDAGDFDGDGRSEVLFWHSEYNEDGYVMFYDDFRSRIQYSWNYH
jgi:hypothetical protein